MRLREKAALVTGATSGIGEGLDLRDLHELPPICGSALERMTGRSWYAATVLCVFPEYPPDSDLRGGTGKPSDHASESKIWNLSFRVTLRVTTL